MGRAVARGVGGLVRRAAVGGVRRGVGSVGSAVSGVGGAVGSGLGLGFFLVSGRGLRIAVIVVIASTATRRVFPLSIDHTSRQRAEELEEAFGHIQAARRATGALS